jgi:hypothetical protein
MKSFLSLILLAAAAMSAGNLQVPLAAAQSSPSLPVDQANVVKARAVLDKAIQALGGPAYLGVQDVSQEGRSYSFHLGRPNSVGTVYWRFYKFPDRDRTEVTKKRDVIYIINGDTGYEITYKGTRSMDPKDLSDYLRGHQYALDVVLRRWINEPGVALFYDGQSVTEQKAVEQVEIMNSRNQAVTLYLDVNSHLPVKKSYSWRDPTDKLRNSEDEVYDNYRSVQGVMTPFSVTRYYNGDMSNQRFLNSVSYNQGLADAKFAASVSYDPNKPPPRK